MEPVFEINSVDLFCGGGGASTGMDKAVRKLNFRRRGVAINHWSIAVSTMRANHPNLNTLDCKIEEAIPAELVHGKVHLLWASPTCTHFSRARGGKPKDNQMRSQPEFVITWLTQCDVDNLIVENVAEFMDWGPLNKDNTPNKKKKGVYFKAWVEHIRALGYNVIYDVLNCADYGDATTRRRFFLMASKKGLPMPKFPDPVYGDHVEGLKQWRAARECLDLSDLGKSIFGRKKSLSKNTLRRIAVGMKKFNGMDFLMDMLGVGESDNCRLKPLSEPLPTQHAGGNRFALVRPFLVELRNHKDAVSIDEPLSTVTTSGAHHMLCEPVILDHMRGGKVHSLDETLGTQCTHDRYSLLTPVLIGQQSCAAARSIDEPCPTVLTAGAIQMATPIVLDDGRFLDIKIRMLKPSELAAAHSFPKDYVFTGNRCEKVKQIGNSVPVNTAAALCESMLKQYAA